MSAFRARPTEPHLEPPDQDSFELAELTVLLSERLERLRHVVALRLAREGRRLASSLREPAPGYGRRALVADVVSFQLQARDLLAGSR